MVVRTLYVGKDGHMSFRNMTLPEEYTALNALEQQLEDMKNEIARKADATALDSLRNTVERIGKFTMNV